MGFLNVIKKVDQAVFLNRDIERLQVEIEVMEEQFRNMRVRLEHLKEVKRQKDMKRK